MQDSLGIVYLNCNSCLNRKSKELSIGKLTNFIKHRATESNNGTHPHFGNTSNKRTNDVYYYQMLNVTIYVISVNPIIKINRDYTLIIETVKIFYSSTFKSQI